MKLNLFGKLKKCLQMFFKILVLLNSWEKKIISQPNLKVYTNYKNKEEMMMMTFLMIIMVYFLQQIQDSVVIYVFLNMGWLMRRTKKKFVSK